ncbi:MAG: hypothetical protein OCD76_21350 [Reichenbachiella sp.]
MKNINLIKYLFALSTLFLLSCQGQEGIPGRDGENGYDGINGTEGFSFEYELNFTSPSYGAILPLPNDFEMLDSDVMMVYLLWEVTDTDAEVWRALQQTLYFDDGILSYNFDFTKFDANVFLDGTVDLSRVGAEWTDNWIARVVVLPAQFSNARSTIDYNNYDQVKEHFGLTPSTLLTKDYPNRSNQ